MALSDAAADHFKAELDQGNPQTLCLPYSPSNQVLFSLSNSVDLEQCSSEHNLGCARGVLWALVFEAALVIAAAVCWEFHLSR